MAENVNLSQTWKTPNEVLKLHRLKRKKEALSARLNQKKHEIVGDNQNSFETVCAQKRKNPFAKNCDHDSKKVKISLPQIDVLSSDDSLMQLIQPTRQPTTSKLGSKKSFDLKPFDLKSFSNLFNDAVPAPNQEETEKSGKYLPIDWGLKSRMRILCESSLPATNLKTNQEASGITSFVRCIDHNQSTPNNLDISLGAKFHQGLHFWQHPALPWLTMFPRNSKDNIGFQIGDKERESLTKDWTESLRGLFQLLRARQCPYFYFCANTFTVLFRAAGIGGLVEMHALMTPTTRGMRNALKQEEIEFSMPLKKDYNYLNKSNEGSFSNSSENPSKTENKSDPLTDDEDMEEEKWLESLGVDENEIKKISSTHTKSKLSQEMADDFSDNSIVLIEGVECQAFFNFLLNAKSSVTNVGRLSGIPPTLLAPVAFPKASMQSLTTRSSKVRNDGVEYFSIEIKGIILPHILPYMTLLLQENKNAFSVTLAAHNNTLAFTKASQKLIEQIEKENSTSDQVFGKSNLSDCGVQMEIIELMCRINKDSIWLFDRICFSKDIGFIWS